MAARFAEADLILCRSGASTMAELAAAGKPSLLVPFAAATDDHQRKNAEVLAEAGAAIMLLERDASPARLLDRLRDLLLDPAARAAMAERAKSLARPGALERIAGIVLRLAKQ